jgi:transcriptional regulator with XRE-family HTH domain
MPEIEVTKLKARLLANRDEKGKQIPQHRVAAATGINPSTLSEYALGRTPFTQGNLRLLCDYFQCDPGDLAGWIRFEFPG